MPKSAAGPEGECTSKSQTTLAYAITDVTAWAERLQGPEAGFDDALDHHVLLTSPTAMQLLDAIADAVERLDAHFDESRGGSINLVYSGHGTSTGAFVLADRDLEPGQLIEALAAGRAGDDGNTRHLRLVLDCCHAGRTLAELLTHEHHWSRYVVRDSFAACLPARSGGV